MKLIKRVCACGCGMSWKANKECANRYASEIHKEANNARLDEGEKKHKSRNKGWHKLNWRQALIEGF